MALIQISGDNSEDDAEEWAAKENFPWLTVLPGDRTIRDLDLRSRKAYPSYLLVDAEGNIVAQGSGEVMSKVASLSGSSED